jgi:hypothetical protein
MVIKSRMMKFMGHVECMEETQHAYNTAVGKLGGRDQLDDLGVDGRMMLIWILKDRIRQSGLV